MGSRAMVLVRAGASIFSTTERKTSSSKALWLRRETKKCFSVKLSLEPPNVARLADTARISLSHQEVEEFGPKIQQVVDWFGQLQAIDLESVDPAVRADTEGGNLREDRPEEFDNRQGLLSGIPKYEEPYIKVPKVLNKE